MPPRESNFRPFLVSFGDDNFFLDRSIEKAKQAKRKTLCLDASSGLTDVQLVDHCSVSSEDLLLVLVDNAQEISGTKELRAFIESRSLNDVSLVLAAIVRSPKLPDVWSSDPAKIKVSSYAKPKRWEHDKYTSFIMNEATRLRISISPAVADALYKFVGPDYYRLSNELKKLVIYVGQAGTVTKEHIPKVTTWTPKSDPSSIAEAALAKNSQQAMNLLSVLYMNSGDELLIPVVRALMREVEKTTVIRSLQDKGVSESDIAVWVGVKEWPLKNIFAPIARKHDLKSLVRHMGRLARLDADVKGPSRSKRTLVEMAILSIAS